MPRCKSGSNSTVWRRIQTPRCHDRLTDIVVEPTPPRTPVIGDRTPAEHTFRCRCLTKHERTKVTRYLIAGQRLWQIVRGAKATGYLAIEVGVVEFPDHQHADVRFDHVRQIAQSASMADPRH